LWHILFTTKRQKITMVRVADRLSIAAATVANHLINRLLNKKTMVPL
jgi:hypothetical protein